jgi:WD40 repeat protein
MQPLLSPLIVLKGHADPVYAVAISPDGQTFATGSFDKTIKLWNAADGKEKRTLGGAQGHTNLVLTLAFHPKEPLLASGSSDNRVLVWDVKADKPAEAPVRTLQHPQLVNAVAFDPAGTRIATGGQDGQLRIWDVSKKDTPQPKVIAAHVPPSPQQPQPIYAVLWTPDGKQLITAGNDRSIKVWDADGAKLVREMKPGSDKPPPAKELLAAAPGAVGGALGYQFKQPPPPGHLDQVYSLALTADGKLLASGSADRTVKLWNPVTGELIRTFTNPALKGVAHPGFVQGVRFTADGSKLVSVGGAPKLKGYVAVWNVADGKVLSGEEVPFGLVYAVDLKADGTAILGCGPKQRGATDSEAVVVAIK